MINVGIKNTSKNELPKYATPGSSGMDIRADLPGPYVLLPYARTLISTGLYFDIPEGYEIQVRPRSGLAFKKGITVLNSPGTIDEDYKDELKIILINTSKEPFTIEPGERIAQIVFAPVTKVEFTEVSELNKTNDRGGGFGHTGTK